MRSTGFYLLVFLISVSLSSITSGQGVLVDDGGDPIVSERPPSRIIGQPILEGDEFQLAPTRTFLLGAFAPTFNSGPSFAANPAAQAAFQRAVAQWDAFISDPITVTFDVDFGSLATGVAATAAPVSLIAPYNTIRNLSLIHI